MLPAAALEAPCYEASASEASPNAKSQRLHFRVTETTRSMVERAASLEGRSMTEFVVEKVTQAARQTIVEHEHLVLRGRQREAFFEALLNPRTPSAAAQEAMRRSRQMFGDE